MSGRCDAASHSVARLRHEINGRTVSGFCLLWPGDGTTSDIMRKVYVSHVGKNDVIVLPLQCTNRAKLFRQLRSAYADSEMTQLLVQMELKVP